jgi:hypothetical protein
MYGNSPNILRAGQWSKFSQPLNISNKTTIINNYYGGGSVFNCAPRSNCCGGSGGGNFWNDIFQWGMMFNRIANMLPMFARPKQAPPAAQPPVQESVQAESRTYSALSCTLTADTTPPAAAKVSAVTPREVKVQKVTAEQPVEDVTPAQTKEIRQYEVVDIEIPETTTKYNILPGQSWNSIPEACGIDSNEGTPNGTTNWTEYNKEATVKLPNGKTKKYKNVSEIQKFYLENKYALSKALYPDGSGQIQYYTQEDCKAGKCRRYQVHTPKQYIGTQGKQSQFPCAGSFVDFKKAGVKNTNTNKPFDDEKFAKRNNSKLDPDVATLKRNAQTTTKGGYVIYYREYDASGESKAKMLNCGGKTQFDKKMMELSSEEKVTVEIPAKTTYTVRLSNNTTQTFSETKDGKTPQQQANEFVAATNNTQQQYKLQLDGKDLDSTTYTAENIEQAVKDNTMYKIIYTENGEQKTTDPLKKADAIQFCENNNIDLSEALKTNSQ